MSLTQLHPVYLEQALSICHLSSCGIVFRLVDIDASQKERLRWQYKWRRGWLYRQKCLGIFIHIIPWFWTCVIHFLVYIWWPDAFALRLFVLIRCIDLLDLHIFNEGAVWGYWGTYVFVQRSEGQWKGAGLCVYLCGLPNDGESLSELIIFFCSKVYIYT